MAITNKKGRIGSQRLLQAAVAAYPDLLNKALQKAGAIKESETVSWTSPLKKDQFKEFQDQAALEKIGGEKGTDLFSCRENLFKFFQQTFN